MIDAVYALLKSFGFDEPLHPPLTHMPIGLVTGALVFILLALFLRRKEFAPSARHAALLAFVFLFPTILFGVFDWIHYYHGALMPAIEIKMALAALVLVVLGAVIILGGEIRFQGTWLAVLLALAFVAVTGLGYLGGSIVSGRAFALPASATAKAASASSPGQEVDPAFARGRQIFGASCQACHGNGGNAIVASLPLKSSAKLASPETLSAFVRNPHMPDGSAGQMPSFPPDQLSAADLADLYVYVSRAWKQ